MNNEYILCVTSEPMGSGEDVVTSTVSDSNVPVQQTRKQPMGSYNWIFFGLMLFLLYFLLFRGPRKQKQEHKQMIQTLEKNDKIRTIGGIIGTVVDVKEDEITLKVDESNNTKIKISLSAVGRNLTKSK